MRTVKLSEAEHNLVTTLDDVHEHMWWEFDRDQYRGVSTCGMASITGIDGRRKFVRRVKSLVEKQEGPWETQFRTTRNGSILIEVAGLTLHLMYSDYRGCYTLSIGNLQDFVEGPDAQRLDAQERLHRLLLERLQYNGYMPEARVTSRMD